MTNNEVWEAYYTYTGDITKHARYVGFAGIAVCWFFKSPEVTFPHPILLALMALVVFFVLDLSQYYVAAMRLRCWIREEERQREAATGRIDGDDYWLPASLDTPTLWLFHLKLVALLLGFAFIGWELVHRLG